MLIFFSINTVIKSACQSSERKFSWLCKSSNFIIFRVLPGYFEENQPILECRSSFFCSFDKLDLQQLYHWTCLMFTICSLLQIVVLKNLSIFVLGAKFKPYVVYPRQYFSYVHVEKPVICFLWVLLDSAVAILVFVWSNYVTRIIEIRCHFCHSSSSRVGNINLICCLCW